MKKFIAIFIALTIVLSLAGALPAAATADNTILSGYYGIDRENNLIHHFRRHLSIPIHTFGLHRWQWS